MNIKYILEHMKYPNHKTRGFVIDDRDDCTHINIQYCCETMSKRFTDFFNYKYTNTSVPTAVIQIWEEQVYDYPSKLLEEEELKFCPFCGTEITYEKIEEIETVH